MKAKTKDQLRGEIIELQAECDGLKVKLEAATTQFKDILLALSCALGATLNNLPNHHTAFAIFTTTFFAELKRTTGIDYTSDELTDTFEFLVNRMGFDQVTAMSIKETINVYFEINKMVHEGKSDKDILEFLEKFKETEGWG